MPSDCTIEKFNTFNEKFNGRKFAFNVPGIVACTQIPYVPWTHVFSSLSDITTAFYRTRGILPPARGRGRHPARGRKKQREPVEDELDMLATCKEKVTISH